MYTHRYTLSSDFLMTYKCQFIRTHKKENMTALEWNETVTKVNSIYELDMIEERISELND